MVSVSIEGAGKVEVCKDSWVYLESVEPNGSPGSRPESVIFASWDDMTIEEQTMAIQLRDSLRTATQPLIDFLTVDLRRFKDCPSQ